MILPEWSKKGLPWVLQRIFSSDSNADVAVNAKLFGTNADGDLVEAGIRGDGLKLSSGFTPSSTGSARLTMDGTAQGGALSTGVTAVQVYNKGATTEDIYVGFGSTQLEADEQLNMTTDGAPEKATTGHLVPAVADAGSAALQVLNVPDAALGGFYAVANAEDGDTQVVVISQGVS